MIITGEHQGSQIFFDKQKKPLTFDRRDDFYRHAGCVGRYRGCDNGYFIRFFYISRTKCIPECLIQRHLLKRIG